MSMFNQLLRGYTWGAVGTGKGRKAPSPWFQPGSKDLYDQVKTWDMA